MALWAFALMIGALAGLATGGRLSSLGGARFRAWPLLLLGVVAEALLGPLPAWARGLMAAAACAAVVAWCVANRGQGRGRATAQALLGLGVTLNAAVIALNAGMPVSRSALVQAGFARHMDVAKDDFYKHVAMTSNTRLAFLGDIFPVHVLHTVVSPGDLVMLLGIAGIAWSATMASSAPARRVRLVNPSSRTAVGS